MVEPLISNCMECMVASLGDFDGADTARECEIAYQVLLKPVYKRLLLHTRQLGQV